MKASDQTLPAPSPLWLCGEGPAVSPSPLLGLGTGAGTFPTQILSLTSQSRVLGFSKASVAQWLWRRGPRCPAHPWHAQGLPEHTVSSGSTEN